MSKRFVDTSGWAAYVSNKDAFHSRAVAVLGIVPPRTDKLVTTNLVLIELTALLVRMKISKADQVAFFDELAEDETVEIVTVGPGREATAWALWRARPDKDWSMVDCVSFVVMNEMGLHEAVTTDHHFEQAGFVRLLK